MKSKMKKMISTLMLCSQILMPLMAQATPQTPEFKLFEHLLALQGQNGDSAQIQGQMLSLVEQYKNTAPVDGQQERIQNAMVDLNLYTPEQVQEMTSQLQQSYESATVDPNSGAVSKSLNDAVTEIVSHNPQGAEFSGCNAVTVAGGIGLFGFIVAGIISANAKSSVKPTSSTVTTGNVAGYAAYGLLAVGVASMIIYLAGPCHE